jgi:hypothetical protein
MGTVCKIEYLIQSRGAIAANMLQMLLRKVHLNITTTAQIVDVYQE